ncbi:YueH family protein [Staphylococcus hominis]|uniref:YueH family protein n=1 Tax=Staphylococcus hominis TaxID=1290 RepID=UPI0021B4EB3B|nr:YueH family protein [Staphylococcus hominis]
MINLYLYKNLHHPYYIIAIPHIFSSLQLNPQLNQHQINQHLIIQLFTFKQQTQPLPIPSHLSNSIINHLNQNNQ